MEFRKLGDTGMQISEIAFGCVEIGMPYGIKEAHQEMPSEKLAIQLLHNALSNGINFYDTARNYGKSEYLLGKAFKNNRNKVVIATKSKKLRNEKGVIADYIGLKQIIESSLNESLEALQTDYVDVFMLHEVDMEILQNEYIPQIFENLKIQGKIRASGLSVYTPAETEKAIEVKAWDVIQLPFNLMDQRQAAYFSRAAEAGIGIMIRSVLMKGVLSIHGRNLHPALDPVKKHIDSYLKYTNEDELPSSAIKFALSFDDVSSVLVGLDKPEYLTQALLAASGNYFNTEKLCEFKKLAYPDPDFLNLHTWNQKGWLK